MTDTEQGLHQPDDAKPDIRVVGVIGAGVMGIGVAQSAAYAGFDVILHDVADELLVRAMKQLRENVRFQGMLVGSPSLSNSVEIDRRISCTTVGTHLRGTDFIVENVPEQWHLKRQVYAMLDEHCPPHCVFAANTSGIPITRIASATRRPAQVIGLHFMNPVPMKQTVELIRGVHTSDDTVAVARGFLRRLGKQAVSVADSPGFVSNRVLMLSINEAINLVHERVASAADVDRVFTACLGHKMGPLATADLIGLDTVLFSIEILQQEFGDPKFRPSVLLRKMVDAGLCGRKSGRGFYEYPNSMGASTAPTVGQAGA